jgi:TM2 domain-containing membrane protein YozV
LTKYPQVRRQRAHLSQFTTTVLQTKNPWVVAFFSFSYPGFGHLLLHRYVAGFILILWETFINDLSNVNLGIMYTLIGDFEKAKEVLDERWLILYVGIYMFGIWDGYRTTVDLNKLYLLADREDAPLSPIKMGGWDINFMDKRKPWVAVVWSALFPGLGHLYIHKVVAGFFIFAYTVGIMYFGHIPLGIQYTMIGEFAKAKEVLDMQWLIYLPSIFFFILYDAYSATVEYNHLFEKEMKKFLRDNYQNKEFKFPF